MGRGSIIKRSWHFPVIARVVRDSSREPQRHCYSGFNSRAEAERFLTRLPSAMDNTTYIAPENLTLAAFVEGEWLPSLDALVLGGRLKATTAAQYKCLAETHVVPALGHVLLREVTAPALNRFYGKLLASGRKRDGGPLSTTTVHAVHVTVHRMFRDAVKWEKSSRNPADYADAPNPRHTTMKIWRADQLCAFLESIRDHEFFALYATMTTTGLRRGEAAGLRWRDLSLDAGTLSVTQTRAVVNYAVHTGSPKTKRSNRTIGLDEATVETLRLHRAKRARELRHVGLEPGPDDLVFTWRDGRPLHPEIISRTFVRLSAKAKLPAIRLHDLRHSYATIALEAGIPLKVVSEHLGHSSISVTGDIYSHVRLAVDKEAAEKIARRIFGSGS